MTVLLDTDICIDLIRGRRPEVRAAFRRRAASGALHLSAITLQELARGVLLSAPAHRVANAAKLEAFLDGPVEVLPYDAADARATADVAALLDARGQAIGAYDTQLAGQALRRGLVLATGNARHFGRVPGLGLEDWREAG